MTPSIDLSLQPGLRHSHHRVLFGDRQTRYNFQLQLLLVEFFGLALDSHGMKGLFNLSKPILSSWIINIPPPNPR